MKKGIIIGIIALLGVLVGYKVAILSKHFVAKADIDTKLIFNETLTITTEEYDGEYINVDNFSVADYFDDYVDLNGTFKAKYEGDKVISFYSVGSSNQYISMLDMKNFEIDTDDTDNVVLTSNKIKKYLDSHNIQNDIDLLQHIKEEYYFKNTIFTSKKQLEINEILNTFVSVTLPRFESITLINGDIEGYIYNLLNDSNKSMKEVHILKDNKQYVILLAGTEITSNDFIEKLLSTVKYN